MIPAKGNYSGNEKLIRNKMEQISNSVLRFREARTA